MNLIPFVHLFRDQAIAETRVITTRDYPGLPDDEYALVESYCPDPKCNCRRVMLHVLPRRQAQSFLAAISFGFDRDDEMAGPFLDPLNLQSQYAEILLDLVTAQVLTDSTYIARLESHYNQVKKAAADPTHPVQKVLAVIRVEAKRAPARKRKSKKRRG
ncbi:MAG TPA: hypothetical protein VJ793_04660 [Anaerolineae bacterium]|nr:hypothetical protein [Anaerolineae bacterium]